MKSGKFSLILLAATSLCFGSTMLLSDQAVEVMMENQGADATTIDRLFGADASSSLQFQSLIDPNSQSFEYFTVPGTSYLGQTMSILSTGTYNSSDGTWSLQTTGSLGGSTWTQSGTGAITGDPTGAFDWSIPIGGGHFLDFHSLEKYQTRSNDPETADSTGTFRFTLDGKTVLSGSTGNDVLHQGPQNHKGWKDEIDVNPGGGGIASFVVDSFGSTPNGGGLGSFTMQIAAVPEPASLGLIGAGLVSLALVGRRKLNGSARQ